MPVPGQRKRRMPDDISNPLVIPISNKVHPVSVQQTVSLDATDSGQLSVENVLFRAYCLTLDKPKKNMDPDQP